jgi:hypothetical protein
MNKLIIYFLFLLVFFPCFAQEDEDEKPINLTYQSTVIGIGGVSVYDTYLSPLEYKGATIGLFHEQMKMTDLMGGNVLAQHQFNLDFSWSDNNEETASDYTGFVEYNYGLFYRVKPMKDLMLFGGVQANALLGVVYNSRNGNNPATAKVHANLNFSGIAVYRFNIGSQPVNLRYQLNIPFVGAMFSPHFGQSYYEISLGDSDHLIYFSSFHNKVRLKNILTAEIPLNSATLRLTYVNNIYETDINDLQTRIHSNSFFIGLSKNFFSVRGEKKNKNYKRIFE